MNISRQAGLLFLLLLCAAALSFWKFSPFLHDDAMISLRYARNFVSHAELVWNLGERVEGYTNLLHILLSSIFIKLGADPINAARGINAFGFFLLVVMSALSCRRLGIDAVSGFAGLAILVGVPAIAWVWGALEAPFSAGLLALALYYTLQALENRLNAAFLASFAFAASYLTRPDLLLVNFAAGLGILLFGCGSLRDRFLRFVAIGSISGLVLALHTAFRLYYYDDWLPMTFYAKVGVDEFVRLKLGARYVFESAVWLPAIFLAPLLAVNFLLKERKLRGPFGLLLMILIFQACYIVWSGGDHMLYARFFVPTLPALVLLVAYLVNFLAGRRKVLAVATLVLSSIAPVVLAPKVAADAAAVSGAAAGLRISALFPEDYLIAIATAGGTGYFAMNHRFIDTLGLNDPVIAKREGYPILTERQYLPGHAKGDGEYVLSRKPDVILMPAGLGRRRDEARWFLTDAELLESEEFKRCYQEVVAPFKIKDLGDDWVESHFSITEHEFIYNERVCD